LGGRHDRRGWAVFAQVGAALILAGLGAGVAGVLAPGASWLARAVGAAVGAITAVAATAWWDRTHQRREVREAAVRARDGFLDAL